MEDLEIINFLLGECQRFRVEGQSRKAYCCYLLACDKLDISHENPSVNKVYANQIYKLLEEFTIFSYYINDNTKKQGLRISDQLIFDYNCFNIINKGQISNNQRFYMKKLEYIDKKRIQVNHDNEYLEMNPSIISNRSGYIMNCRTSNFGVKPGGVYYSKSTDGIVNTKNYILELDREFKIKSQVPLIDESIYDEYNTRPIKGLEDVIIFMHNDELWCTCTTLDTHPSGVPQISLCKIDFVMHDDSNEDEYVIKIKRPMNLLQSGRPEKNWLPFSHEDMIKFVYGYSPTQIRTPSSNLVNICKELGYLDTNLLTSNDTHLNFDRFRGSAGPLMIEMDGTRMWLIVVHEVSWCLDKSRIYTHRFVLLTLDFKIIKLSDPWYFEQHGIEFCRGMCSYKDTIILTCGLKDEEAWCYILDKKKVLESLHDLDKFILRRE